MKKSIKLKIINDLKQMFPQMKDKELEITKDEIAIYLWKQPKRDLGFHPLYRLQARKGIAKVNNKESLALMYNLINNELERRNNYVSKINQSQK